VRNNEVQGLEDKLCGRGEDGECVILQGVGHDCIFGGQDGDGWGGKGELR
jgi:hypothetical protein